MGPISSDALRLVFLDTNVFVSAVKDASRETATMRLLVRLLERRDMRLVGNEFLAREYLRYAEAFPSPTAAALVAAVLGKMEIVNPEDRFIRACAPYFPGNQVADRVHAATSLQTGAVLVSNDRHFRAIHASGLIRVLTTSEAVRLWAPTQ